MPKIAAKFQWGHLQWGQQVQGNFKDRKHISEMAEARVVKFCTWVEYIKACNDNLPPDGRGQVMLLIFKFWNQ